MKMSLFRLALDHDSLLSLALDHNSLHFLLWDHYHLLLLGHILSSKLNLRFNTNKTNTNPKQGQSQSGNLNWQNGPSQPSSSGYGSNQSWSQPISSQQQMFRQQNSRANSSATPDRHNWSSAGDGYRPENHSTSRANSSSPVNSSNPNNSGPIGWQHQ